MNFSIEDLKKLEYVGGGYFRLPVVDGKSIPKGKAAPIIHSPELLDLLLKILASNP